MKFSLELRKQWILDRKIGYLERKRKRDSNRNVWHRFSIQFHLLFILLIAKTQHMAEPQPENSCMCVCVFVNVSDKATKTNQSTACTHG